MVWTIQLIDSSMQNAQWLCHGCNAKCNSLIPHCVNLQRGARWHEHASMWNMFAHMCVFVCRHVQADMLNCLHSPEYEHIILHSFYTLRGRSMKTSMLHCWAAHVSLYGRGAWHCATRYHKRSTAVEPQPQNQVWKEERQPINKFWLWGFGLYDKSSPGPLDEDRLRGIPFHLFW